MLAHELRYRQRRRLFGNVDHHDVAVGTDREGLLGEAGGIPTFARLQVEPPEVGRARHHAIPHHAIGERRSFVGAGVVNGPKRASVVEDSNASTLGLHDNPISGPEVLDRPHLYPHDDQASGNFITTAFDSVKNS